MDILAKNLDFIEQKLDSLSKTMDHLDLKAYPLRLGDHFKRISTESTVAQAWFDRGLSLMYGFNHEEAIVCFQKATEVDSKCAIAFWGIALSLGINYNNPDMEEENCTKAYESLQKALECSKKRNVTPVEKALIESLQHRYPSPHPPQERTILETDYANAMRKVYSQFSDDPDVASLFAESLMNLHPWKLWKDGKPGINTPEITETIEKGLKHAPRHPGLLHLMIHLMELSPHPEKALPHCLVLEDLIPDIGHLRHMPSHIYVQLGKYPEAIVANQKGIEADKKFLALRGPKNFYTLYRMHNYHFLMWAAMFNGQFKPAIEAGREIAQQLNEALLEGNSFLDYLEPFHPMFFHVLIRFGKWEEILQEPLPTNKNLFCYTETMAHYARGLAYAALRRTDEAENEQRLFEESLAKVPPTRRIFYNTCHEIAKIARLMLDGEIQYRKGDFEKSFELLRQAVALDDAMPYDEPWSWMQPVRHALGALLLEQNRIDEAESVYKQDLKIHPNNCWSLHGLAECLEKKGLQRSNELDSLLEKATATADVPIKASCFCRLSAYQK